MLNTVELNLIAKTLNLPEAQLNELLKQCGIEPRDGTVTIAETASILAYAKENNFSSERRAQEYLEKSARNCTIIVDTCELLNEHFPEFLEHLCPLLREYGKQMLVPSGVASELKNLYFKNEELREQISTVLELLEAKEAEGLVAVCGKQGETFADQQMLTIATCAMLSEAMLFVTRDNRLAEDILHLNELGSVRGGRIFVNRITRYGYLSRFVPTAA